MESFTTAVLVGLVLLAAIALFYVAVFVFKQKNDLPLIDLVKYEAELKSIKATNDAGGVNGYLLPYPRIPPAGYLVEPNYTAKEQKQIDDNHAAMLEIWRRYSGE